MPANRPHPPARRRRRVGRLIDATLVGGLLLQAVTLINAEPTPTPAGAALPVSVDLMRSSSSRLALLPGIGAAKARAIVVAREIRPLATIEDLEQVHGIGPRTVGRIRATRTVRVTVARPGDP